MNLKKLETRILKLLVFQGENVAEPKMFSSILIIISGLILYLDKVLEVLEITLPVPVKFEDAGVSFSFFIWVWAQTISPILIILGTFSRPYRLCYLVPLFCYSIQICFLLFDSRVIDDSYLVLYIFGTFTIILLILWLIGYMSKQSVENKLNSIKKELAKKIENETK